MKRDVRQMLLVSMICAAIWCSTSAASSAAAYQVFVSNEKSGDLTVIDGENHKVVTTIPVGKRPRGLRASPDGQTVYVALSGSPISPPPRLDAGGNPVFEERKDKDDDDEKTDKTADGIGVVEVARKKFVRKIRVGSDPETLALSADGRKFFVSNEDIATASVIDIASGKVEHIVQVSGEPEGVTTSPDGKFFYVTCETEGDIYAIDAKSGKAITHFRVGGRPRTVDFLPDSSRAFIPSESSGELHVVDSVNHKVVGTIALPKGSRPMGVVVGPGAKKIYVSTGRGGTVCVLDANTFEVLNTIMVGTRPWGIAISPDGKFLFTANGPSDDVSVVDLATEKEVARVKAGSSPWGVVIVSK